MSLDFIRVPLDSTGKRTAARAVTIPAGTIILDKDGTQSTLASDVTCFVQQTVASAVVNDTPEVYTPADIQALSITTDGRLRVSSVQAHVYLDQFGPLPLSTVSDNPWALGDHPWSSLNV